MCASMLGKCAPQFLENVLNTGTEVKKLVETHERTTRVSRKGLELSRRDHGVLLQKQVA